MRLHEDTLLIGQESKQCFVNLVGAQLKGKNIKISLARTIFFFKHSVALPGAVVCASKGAPKTEASLVLNK